MTEDINFKMPNPDSRTFSPEVLELLEESDRLYSQVGIPEHILYSKEQTGLGRSSREIIDTSTGLRPSIKYDK